LAQAQEHVPVASVPHTLLLLAAMMNLNDLFADGAVAGSSSALSFSGDFDYYREPDNVCRGLTLDSTSSADLMPLLGDRHDSEDWKHRFEGFWQPLDEHRDDLHLAKSSKQQSPGLQKRPGTEVEFDDSHEAPGIPSDPFFCLEQTHFNLPNSSPAQAAKQALKFIDNELPSSITKVSHKKFSLKADVSLDGYTCDLKVRVYKQVLGCTVEFQRRGGSCVAFRDVYTRAVQSFLGSGFEFDSQSARPADVALPCPRQVGKLPTHLVGEEARDMSVIVDLAKCKEVGLQAEAASFLAEELREEPSKAWQSLSEVADLTTVLLNLLQTDCFSVALPTARVLAYLADLPEAEACMLSQDLLCAMLSKVQLGVAGRHVGEHLAGAVHSIILRCASQLTGKHATQLVNSLNIAVEGQDQVDVNSSSITKKLIEAVHVLTSGSLL